jgi:hypothetical protein
MGRAQSLDLSLGPSDNGVHSASGAIHSGLLHQEK